MSEDQRVAATLAVLRVLASTTSSTLSAQYRLSPDQAIVEEKAVRLTLASMDKPLSCISRMVDSVLELDVQRLSERYPAEGLVEVWAKFQQRVRQPMLDWIKQKFGSYTDDFHIRIAAGEEVVELDLEDYFIWQFEYQFPEAYAREDEPSEGATNQNAKTMRYGILSGPKIEGAVKMSAGALPS